jgi:glyoxylase-like metal-dependent hydrolase (beta-lactamase superfamily II)
MSISLYAFNCGWFQCKAGFFIEGLEDQSFVRSPVPAYLIDHPNGRALFDTGLGERIRRAIEARLPHDKFGLELFEGMDIAARLRAIDVDPSSINWIIASHLHNDHCGGMMFVPNATVIVQSREWAAAQASEDPWVYNKVDFDTGHSVKAIDGELDLFGDGTVMIVPTYGHTPGHQSAIVRLAGGEILLAADCCYTERNLNERVLPGFTFDKEAGLVTLDRLAQLRAKGTRIMFGHDATMWKSVTEGAPVS